MRRSLGVYLGRTTRPAYPHMGATFRFDLSAKLTEKWSLVLKSWDACVDIESGPYYIRGPQPWWHYCQRREIITLLLVPIVLGIYYYSQALRRSEAYRKRTRLIVLFWNATPRQRASELPGDIASNHARLALQDSNKRSLQALEVNSKVLDSIHKQFVNIICQSGIQIYSFQEARGISGIKGLHGKVRYCNLLHRQQAILLTSISKYR